MKIQPGIAILVFVIVIIVALFSCVIIPPGSFENSRLKTFVTIFAGLSLVLTVMFYYTVIRLQVVQSELLELKETQEIQNSVMAVNKQITCSWDIIPEFCMQLLPLQSKYKSYSHKTSTPYENELSWLIFNVFQVTVLEYKFIKEQETYYTRLFLQWTTSKILKRNWLLMRISLTPKAQQFGDLLFHFAPKDRKHDPDSYISACNKMRMTEEYKAIFC